MSDALLAQGTLLKIGDGGGSEVFTTIPEITELSISGNSAEQIDVTSHDSTSGFREYIAGLKDGGVVNFSGNYVPDNTYHLQVHTDQEAGTLRNFQLVMPDSGSTTWSFAALITEFSPSFAPDAQATFTGSLKISGVITRA